MWEQNKEKIDLYERDSYKKCEMKIEKSIYAHSLILSCNVYKNYNKVI